MTFRHTERGLDRLVNFTDAAVAIAITLLVLPLVDLGTELGAKGVTLGDVLGNHWSSLIAFAISFAVIGNMWTIHHALFELVREYDSPLLRLNLLWIFLIAALPFSTNLVANTTNNAGVYAIYLGNIFLASVSVLAMRLYLSRHPALLQEDAASQLRVVPAIVPTACLLLALILAVLVPSVGALWTLIMFAGAPIERIISNRERAKAAREAS